MLGTIFSGMDDMIVIVVAFVVLFGGSQLPKLARNTGKALREFRNAQEEAEIGANPSAGTPHSPRPSFAGAWDQPNVVASPKQAAGLGDTAPGPAASRQANISLDLSHEW